MQNNKTDMTNWVFGDMPEVVIHSGGDMNQWLFGDAAQLVVKSEQPRRAVSIADTRKRIQDIRKSANALFGIKSTTDDLVTVELEDICGDPVQNAGCYLSPNRVLTQAVTKGDMGVTPTEVARVDNVRSMADLLMLKWERVMELIESDGFDAVEQTISTLAGQAVNKSLHDSFFGFPVTHIRIEDVQSVIKSRKIEKAAGNQQDLQAWLGMKLK